MDKFNILPQNYNQDTLKQSLLSLGLTDEKAGDVMKLQSKCGMARYSPIGVSKEEVFKEVQEMITELG